jgi:hypothetical protein
MSNETIVPIVFVNSVAVSGFLNGICNFCFTTAQFIANDDGKVSPSEVITANLRMDLLCAQQLHDSLASILAQQVKPSKGEVN